MKPNPSLNNQRSTLNCPKSNTPAILLCALLYVCGCSKSDTGRLDRMADAIDDNFSEVTNRIYSLEAENKALAKRVFELEMADWELALMVDPESTGYTIYETKQTRLFVTTKRRSSLT